MEGKQKIIEHASPNKERCTPFDRIEPGESGSRLSGRACSPDERAKTPGCSHFEDTVGAAGGDASFEYRIAGGEWPQIAVTNINIDADRGIQPSSAQESLQNDLKFLQRFRATLVEYPQSTPPQSMCSPVLRMMMRTSESPTDVQIVYLAYRALQLMHELNPHVEVKANIEDGNNQTPIRPPFVLRVLSQAWQPMDSDLREQGSMFQSEACEEDHLDDAQRFENLLKAAARAARDITSIESLGSVLLLKHCIHLICHDMKCRMRVFDGCAKPAVLLKSTLWRLLRKLGFSQTPTQNKLMGYLFEMISSASPSQSEGKAKEGTSYNLFSTAELCKMAQDLLGTILQMYSTLEAAGEFSHVGSWRSSSNPCDLAYMAVATQFRTRLRSSAQELHFMRTMTSPTVKLRLVRTALSCSVNQRASQELHAGGSGGTSGAWDVVKYLQRGVADAAKQEKHGSDTTEDGINRIALYLAQTLQAVAQAPPNTNLRKAEIVAALPDILKDLRESSRNILKNPNWCLDAPLQAALVAAELALVERA